MMECNKDEAIRAIDIAEKKMQNNDFEGALSIAVKAQQLFPELENINQLLTVCKVHCAAQNKILGSEKDFYGILQLEQFADEVAIRKQYRKLALTLHPDKNKLPGAEAAFKLVGEANVLLLDPGKKVVYDSKYKVSVRTAHAQPPPYQYTSLNRRQTTSKPSVLQETFWTACNYCKTKFQYLKKYVNHVVHCQICKRNFKTNELSALFCTPNMDKPLPKPMPPGKAVAQNVTGSQPRTEGVSICEPHSQGVPSMTNKASGYQISVFPPKDGPHPSNSRMDLKNTDATHTMQGCGNTKTVSSEFGMIGNAANGENMKSDNKDGSDLNSVTGGNGKHEGVSAHKKEKEPEIGDNGRKRRTKHVEESSKSCDTSSSKDTVNYELNALFCTPNMDKPLPKPMPPGKVAAQNVTGSQPRTEGVPVCQPHSQGVPSMASKTSGYQTPVLPPKDGPYPSNSRIDLKNTDATHTGQECGNTKIVSSEFGMIGNAAGGEKMKSDNKDGSNLNSVAGGNGKHEGVSAHKKEKEPGIGNNGRKRGRKHMVESSKSCDTSSSKDTVDYELSALFCTPNMDKPLPKPMPPGKAATQNATGSQPRTEVVSVCEPYSQGVPSMASKASGYQTPFFPPKDDLHPSNSRMDLKNTDATRTGQGCGNTKTASSKFGMIGSAADGEKMKSDNKDGSNLNSATGGNGKHEGVYAHRKEKESGIGNNGRKRGRKYVVESSESSDTLSGKNTVESSENREISSSKNIVESSQCSDSSSSKVLDEDAFEEDCATYSAHPNSGVDATPSTRRSSCPRQNVLYDENGSDDDDFESPSKRPSMNKSSGDDVVQEAAVKKNEAEPFSTSAVNTKANVDSEGNRHSEKDFSEGTSQMEKCPKATSTMGHVPGAVEILDDFGLDPDLDGTDDSTVYYCPDPEFTDFDKEKEECCFAVDQIWALYDTIDGMPRFYAQIKKIFKPGFKVLIIWLEGDPIREFEISWLNEELPFGCGRFEWGDSKITSDRLTFSHQVHFEKDKNSTAVFIRPQKGEIWALMKDWNRDWSHDPDNHRKYKFEIVEVISDFSKDVGIRVSYLDKVRGFVCLFQRASVSESNFRLIRPDQMLMFSHSIPSRKMSGTEREGVPVGSFELDPASLPQDPDDICYPLKVVSDNENMQKRIKRSPGKSGDSEGKTVAGLNADFLQPSPEGIKVNGRK